MDLMLTTVPFEWVALLATSMAIAALVQRLSHDDALSMVRVASGAATTAPVVQSYSIPRPSAELVLPQAGTQRGRQVRRRERARRAVRGLMPVRTRQSYEPSENSGILGKRPKKAGGAAVAVGMRAPATTVANTGANTEAKAGGQVARMPAMAERLDKAAQFDRLDGQVSAWIDGVKRVESLQDTLWNKVDSMDYALVRLRSELSGLVPELFGDEKPVAVSLRAAQVTSRRAEPRRPRGAIAASGRAQFRDAFVAA